MACPLQVAQLLPTFLITCWQSSLNYLDTAALIDLTQLPLSFGLPSWILWLLQLPLLASNRLPPVACHVPFRTPNCPTNHCRATFPVSPNP